MLDNSGFVVISEDKLNTGKFFGEIDGTVLNSLVKNNVFKKIKIYDYQVRFLRWKTLFSFNIFSYPCLTKCLYNLIEIWTVEL